ncbi:MAG: extracellular solute-binding protein [Oscillatoria sp. SIO1A7]|nr:extracellular solute-binding protein [Oscillatoria sp. SIO1A7]
MKRRSFILGASALALGQLLAGCGGQNKPTLRVWLLKSSVPALFLKKFGQSQSNGVVLDFTAAAQLQDLFDRLVAWKKNPPTENLSWWQHLPFFRSDEKNAPIADLVTVADYWLAATIERELIEPLDPKEFSDWEGQLTDRWRKLVKRDAKGALDETGQVWGAPYRWGTTAIAYRRDKFKSLGWEPKDWSDLWRPEIRDRISIIDQPREAIGLTLKKLGYSYNAKDLAKISGLKEELQSLNQQVKFYSSDTYLQPLITGDTWLAVGWSSDILGVMQRYRQIAAVVPLSGTALWADLWVRPKKTRRENTSQKNTDNKTTDNKTTDNKTTGQKTSDPGSSPTKNQLPAEWIEFCWQRSLAAEFSLISKGASAILLETMERSQFPKDLQNNSLLLPDAKVIEKSEFLYPLPPEVAEQYDKLWREIRRGG